MLSLLKTIVRYVLDRVVTSAFPAVITPRTRHSMHWDMSLAAYDPIQSLRRSRTPLYQELNRWGVPIWRAD